MAAPIALQALRPLVVVNGIIIAAQRVHGKSSEKDYGPANC